ncbi:hypothetical protein Natpe_0364 [Natrinema pellirubrum DSM 15624]|uniref:Uncharacterized protein n=1 Tax=Natrinema pellirubrum (strain DSM 15624 / CIP 106293 / JCM 10476 / NCIMB 786 / 157) TaxID=797303 RepID=L0JJ00_NATP1|nr:halocin C8-like domain-containing protein [Natrinema pellirubrum]AGB30296.1 hypothetical protein Natpe_0364 [Natrinema pellirubrum DSM 15624]
MSDESQDSEFNRRDILKTGAITGIASVGLIGVSGVGSATGDGELNSGDIDDLNVIDTNKLSESETEDALEVVKRSEIGNPFVDDVKDKHGLEEAGAFATQVITSNESINEKNPVVIIFGLKPKEETHKAGIIYAVTVDGESGGRNTAIARGMVSTEQAMDSGVSEVMDYAPDGENGAKSNGTYEVEPSSDNLSTQSFHDTIGQETCIAIIVTACEKFGDNIQRSQCAGVCTSVGPSGPVGYTACLAFCAAAVEVIQRHGCSAGGSALCSYIFD